MKTIEINLYKFCELSEKAKQKAINNLYDINVIHDWWEFTYDDAARVGIKLTGFGLDRCKHANGEFVLNALEVAQNIVNEHGESCETHKTALSFLEEHAPIFSEYLEEETEELEDELVEIENKFLEDILEDYANILQNESDYLMSEEAIIETIEANDYDFTEDGKLF